MNDLFDIMQTTRSMRRLKPDPVPDELIRKILEAGSCAANGGNTQRWRFLVLKDPKIKQAVQAWYKKAFDEVVGPRYATSAPPPGVSPERYKRQHSAVEYLTDHFHEAPVWIVACIDEGKTEPTRWSGASIYPAVQNMLLATRALGLGSTLTTRHLLLREGSGSSDGPARGRAFLRYPSHRLPDGQLRSGRPRQTRGHRVSGQMGPAVRPTELTEAIMPRIPPIATKDQLPPEHQYVFDQVIEVFGRVRGPFSMLLHSPKLAERLLPMVPFAREGTVIDPRLRQIAVLAAVRERDSNYVWAAQVDVSRRVGLPEPVIDLLRAKGDPSSLPEEERDIVAYTRQLMRTNRVEQAVFDALLKRHDAQWLVELTTVANFYVALCGVVNAFDVPTPPDGDRF